MARDVPSAGGESRVLRQGSTSLVWRASRRSRGVFQTHAVVYERGEDGREGERGVSVARDIFVCEVAAVCDVVDHRREQDRHRADARYHGAPAKFERFDTIGDYRRAV